jgi:DNA-binding XRE family transcriptional regulator
MSDARTWLDKRIKELRIEQEAGGDRHAVDYYLWSLAGGIGEHLRGCNSIQFAMAVEAMVTEYAASLPLAPAGFPVPVVNGITSTLTMAQLEGAEVRFARLAKKYEQNELGVLTGLPNSTISKWENGKFTPTDEQRARMRAVLDLPPMPTMQLPL